MDEAKFSASIEAKLAQLKSEKQKRIDLVEAEMLRKETDPSEIERIEASLWLQQEIQALGDVFVAKATELGIDPRLWRGRIGRSDKPGDIVKEYQVLPDGSMIITELKMDSSDWKSHSVISERTNNRQKLVVHEKIIEKLWESKKAGKVDLLHQIKPIQDYQFTAGTIDEGQKYLDETTTALVDILGERATEFGAI